MSNIRRVFTIQQLVHQIFATICEDPVSKMVAFPGVAGVAYFAAKLVDCVAKLVEHCSCTKKATSFYWQHNQLKDIFCS